MPRERQFLRSVLWTALLWLASLAVGVSALILAEFGAPVWVFVLVFAWLLSLGLPTLLGVLLVTRFWQGPSFALFIVSSAAAAFFLQWLAVQATQRAIHRWRKQGQP